MKISVLANDTAKEGFEAEAGLAFLIENGKRILFDAGLGEVIFKNAKKLKADLSNIDTIVLSHGHFDHSDGLEAIVEKGIKTKLVLHPNAFVKRYIKVEDKYIGMPFIKSEIEEDFEIIEAKEPYKIDENITFLGEIPRRNEFEARRIMGYYFDNERKKDDYVSDDSALAVKTEKGIVIVTGCSHSGICNIIEHAKTVTGEQKIYAVVGGLHLMDTYENVLRKTIAYLKEQNLEKLLVCHCIDEKAMEEFNNEELKFSQLNAGDIIEL